jgi:hypothetical protein
MSQLHQNRLGSYFKGKKIRKIDPCVYGTMIHDKVVYQNGGIYEQCILTVIKVKKYREKSYPISLHIHT